MASTSEWHCDHECTLPRHFLLVVEWPVRQSLRCALGGRSPGKAAVMLFPLGGFYSTTAPAGSDALTCLAKRL